MNRTRTLLFGAFLAFGARTLLNRLILEMFRANVRKLDKGDYSGLLSMYADDAVLMFNDGDHRWAGEHRGKPAIERFLQDFTGAGLQGKVNEIWTSGPPWAMTLVAQFDDEADGPDGEQLYSNHVMVLLRLRWGKITEHYDYYEDTGRILDFEAKLTNLGVNPV